jgi:hypothetical protein
MTTSTKPFQRRFPRLPDPAYLSEDAARLHAEADTIGSRRLAAVQALAALGEAAELEAVESDRIAAAVAVRAGKPAFTTGTPAHDQLIADRKRYSLEIDALDEAGAAIEAELLWQLEVMCNDEKLSGRAALKAATPKYAKALEALVAARNEWAAAKVFHDFMSAYSSRPGSLPERPWRGHEVPMVAVDQIDRSGERGYSMRPVPASHLLETTFGRELNGDNS